MEQDEQDSQPFLTDRLSEARRESGVGGPNEEPLLADRLSEARRESGVGGPNEEPLLFTPLVRQAGEALPDWLFGPDGVAGLPAPLRAPQGVNIAVGIDIIEVERVRRVFERHGERFLQRVFTEIEVRQCRGKASRLAGRFAAKEAISKALGTGLHGVAWREMEIVQLRSGRPSVRLHGRAKLRAEFLGLSAFDVSIADLAQFSIAVAVAVQSAPSGQG